MIFTEVTLEKAKSYRNKRLTVKVEKKQPLVLGVEVDNFSFKEGLEEYKLNKNLMYLKYVGTLEALKLIQPESGVNVCRCIQVGNDVDEEVIKSIVAENPVWVTPCIELPEDFKNIRFVCDMCKKYENLRFIGGKLFKFPEVRFGLFTRKDLENKGFTLKSNKFMFDNMLAEVDFIEDSKLTIEAKDSKKASKSTSSNGGVKKSPTKKEKRAVRFSSLLNSNQVEL